jgi:hypothetical protein
MASAGAGNGASRERTGRRSVTASAEGERASREGTGRTSMVSAGEGSLDNLAAAFVDLRTELRAGFAELRAGFTKMETRWDSLDARIVT